MGRGEGSRVTPSLRLVGAGAWWCRLPGRDGDGEKGLRRSGAATWIEILILRPQA